MYRPASRTDPAAGVTRRLEKLHADLGRWCMVWGLSRLAREADIQFADDLGMALGRCDPRSGRIVLNGVLLAPENETLLAETLCHEAAHIVAHLRYGPRIAEHGPEWQEYMIKAGFQPRPVIPIGQVAGMAPQPEPGPRLPAR